MKNIVITGGLGYIGTELCKLYSGKTRIYNITVIDNRFVSERVKQLKDWGFKFIQVNILDEPRMKDILMDSDVVIHLAGITDVAYVKTHETPEKDKLIIDTALNGTLNILHAIRPDTKFIFPSTHVVYEGLEKATFDITEEIPSKPVLTYARCKHLNEYDVKNLNNNHVILRLGSVYGYSTDTMRIGIMPNLFSKMAAQNETIKLFSGGVQYKSLVAVWDVARCIEYMVEESSIKNETFHLTHENITVKEVSEICKKHKPSVNIVATNDEIPNVGYTLSNEKLLKTGFKFLYNVDDAIKEMINNWSSTPSKPDEYIIRGGEEFIDDRGKISNYELPEPINLIGYIESQKGTVRANHYHPVQEQKCLLIKGRYISVTKDLGKENAQILTKEIRIGDIAVIQPNVAHTMVFLEDSIFLNLVRGERKHNNYGITHTIPYKLVDDNLRDNILKQFS